MTQNEIILLVVTAYIVAYVAIVIVSDAYAYDIIRWNTKKEILTSVGIIVGAPLYIVGRCLYYLLYKYPIEAIKHYINAPDE